MPPSSKHSPAESDSRDKRSLSWPERNVNGIIYALVAACAATLVAQLFPGLGYNDHHPAHFPQETWFGFEAIFGFLAFIGVVFLGIGLRLIVGRKENYYDS